MPHGRFVKTRQTHEKRRKEQARQERQKEKAERRAQRKVAPKDGTADDGDVGEMYGPLQEEQTM